MHRLGAIYNGEGGWKLSVTMATLFWQQGQMERLMAFGKIGLCFIDEIVLIYS